MNRAEVEIVIAVALWQAGVISRPACEAAVGRADRRPVFRCQDLMNWRMPRDREPCEVCGEPSRRHGLCRRCESEHNAIYHANGKRRIFGLAEDE